MPRNKDFSAPPDPVKVAILKAFGLHSFLIGNLTTQWIDSIWIVEFPVGQTNFYLAGLNELRLGQEKIGIDGEPAGYPILNHYRGLLLATSSRDFAFFGDNPLRAFEQEYPDKIVTHLQNLNVIPRFGYVIECDGPPADEFTVHVYTEASETHSTYHLNKKRPNLDSFKDAIVETMQSLAELYEDFALSHAVNYYFSYKSGIIARAQNP